MDNSPKVFTTGETVKANKKWYQTWRIIYPILGIVLIVELILGLKTLLAPLPKAQIQKLQPISGARIVLVSSKTAIKVGESVPVTIRVVTSGHNTVGTDLALSFDPKILQADTNSFIRGKIYSDYPLVSIDSKIGTIKVSGTTSSVKQGFNGVGELGTINFIAKAAGETTLTVDFKKGSTDDSNVVDVNDSKDVLENVHNLKLTIK